MLCLISGGGSALMPCPAIGVSLEDNNSLSILKNQNIDPPKYIDNCDCNTLLAKLGNSLVITGDTGTNVGNVVVYLLK